MNGIRDRIQALKSYFFLNKKKRMGPTFLDSDTFCNSNNVHIMVTGLKEKPPMSLVFRELPQMLGWVVKRVCLLRQLSGFESKHLSKYKMDDISKGVANTL